MRTLKLLVLAAILLGGCSVLQRTRLFVPESAGFTKITENLYVESGADEAVQKELSYAVLSAENAIRAAYESVTSHPTVHACISEACYKKFGAGGSTKAVIHGYRRILLSPRGLNWHYIAHEWSHAEMFSRLSLAAWWWRLPDWFDEGVAVAVSDAPETSESHWQFLVESNVPRPTREELFTFRTPRQWNNAVNRYGAPKNLERKARGEPEIRPVYTAAGREVRFWLAQVSSAGLLRLIEQLNSGVAFESAYQADNNAVEWDAPHPSP